MKEGVKLNILTKIVLISCLLVIVLAVLFFVTAPLLLSSRISRTEEGEVNDITCIKERENNV